MSQALVDEGLRRHFPLFLQRAFMHLNGGEGFLANWHLDAISHRLDLVHEAGGARLIITMPPRSLKSITVSVAWVAWMLGQNPYLKFVCASYAQELASKLARDCRDLMQSDWYRRVFPATTLERIAEHDLRTSVGGGRFSTSVGGTLTGFGGDIIIIDDPIKPDEAASAAERNRVLDWYSAALSSRLNNKVAGSIVLVMQRVHEDDLAGHLLRAGGWDHLNLPAIAEIDEQIPIGRGQVHQRREGDVLHSAREPREVLEHQRRIMTDLRFSAQYQQRPIPVGGNLVQREWFRFYDRAPERQVGDAVIQSWDTASKGQATSDYSVCVTALVRRREVYILDVFRDRLKFPDLVKKSIELARRYDATNLLIEDTASGTQLLDVLKDSLPAGVPRPIRIQPKGDKESRMSGASNRIVSGEVLLPKDAPWLASFLDEVLSFPGGRFDDQVDAFAQLLNWRKGVADKGVPAGPILYVENERTGNLDVYGSLFSDNPDDADDPDNWGLGNAMRSFG